MQDFRENIRLVIWDLDETFWQGTLEEGEVVIDPAVKEIIPELTRRGIVNSICSKNNMQAVRDRLEQEGLWDWFVFPRVAYEMKAALVADIVEQMGLRPPSVLFIDDNPFNRGEVADRLADLNIASEEVVPHLLQHAQLQGKPDPELTRLQRYRVLQEKQTQIAQASDPGEYLRTCGIQISFHYDVEAQFNRVHDLVNRTNQLNFTKLRWDEDINAAREAFLADKSANWLAHYGYVKVSDKFGYYGICGYFQIQPPWLKHFLFSCRVLNMGVEQFVFETLNFPWINIQQPCVGNLERTSKVDWIKIVDDAEVGAPAASNTVRPSMCLRGPCELAQTAHYLRTRFSITEENGWPRGGWHIQQHSVRYLALAIEMARAGFEKNEDLDLPANFAGFDFNLLSSNALKPSCEARVFCFSSEADVPRYKHVRTGLVLPLTLLGYSYRDFAVVPTDTLTEQLRDLSIEDIEKVKENFVYAGAFEPEDFLADLRILRWNLERSDKPVIIVEAFDDQSILNHPKYAVQRTTNALVRQVFHSCPIASFVRMNDCVQRADQEVSPNHFQREVYMKLAELIEASLEGSTDASRHGVSLETVPLS